MASLPADSQLLESLLAGVVVGTLCACFGVLVVLRRQSFAGHAITDIGFTGGAGAASLGLPALVGLLTFSVLGGLGMAQFGTRARERDVATGVLLTGALGLGALFLYIQTRYVGEPAALLFGSIFAVSEPVLRATILIGVTCLIGLVTIYRPLLFVTAMPEAAAARGVRVRLVESAFMLLVSVAVAEAAQVAGVLLTTGLLIGPASTMLLAARRVGVVMALAALLAAAIVCASILLSYWSYDWFGAHKGWPVSFFVGTATLAAFCVGRLTKAAR